MFKNKKIYLYDLNMNLIKEFNSTQECATFLNKDTMYLYHNLKYCSRIRYNDNWYILRRDKYVEKINKEYQASEHQLNDVEKNRDKYIGGSDLPYILGNGMKYGKTRIEFAKQKLGIMPNNFKGNEYTRYGQYIEPLVRNYMNDTFGYHFVEDSKIDPLKRYRANCDGIDKEQKMLLEVKTFSGKLDIKYYEPQCQFYMDMFDIEECLLVGYDRPEDFYTGIDFSLDNTVEFFNLNFDETRLVIYKLKRNRPMFEKIEVEINKFKYLLDCLREEEIVNNKVKQVNN